MQLPVLILALLGCSHITASLVSQLDASMPMDLLLPPPAVSKSQQLFVLESVNNIIDLTRTIYRQETTIVVQPTDNKQTQSETIFYLAQPLEASNKVLALFEVRVKNKKGQLLAIRKDVAHDHLQYYTVTLPATTLGKTTLYVKSIYTKHVIPYPRKIKQLEPQLYEIQGNAHFLTPYKSTRQRTTVKLPNRKEPSTYTKSPKPVTRKDETIIYGPYLNVPALSRSPLYVHYADTQAVLLAKEYTKYVEVSHWGGNIAVQEDYELHHKGAELKDHFSRIDFKLSAQAHSETNVVKDLTAILPKGARNVFFKDTIGNVSTSHFRNDRESSMLWIQPRYPLFGGWRYSWFHGYDVSAESFLKKISANKFVLQLPFKSSVKDITAVSAKLVAVLPEGASNVEVATSLDVDQISESVIFSYLDSTGRPAVTIQTKNLIDDLEGVVQITYSYDTMRLLQKPFVVFVYTLGVFFIFIIYSRLDFSISPDVAKDKEERLEIYRIKISEIVKMDSRRFTDVSDAFEHFKSTRNLKMLDQVYKTADKDSADMYRNLDDIATLATLIDKSFGQSVHKLIDLLKERTKVARTMQQEVQNFIKDTSNGSDQAKKRAMNAQINQSLAKVDALCCRIASVLEHVGE
ncbi:dolichyl-diphosphooligosaccharide--protein glycosyltransferase subunit 1 [Batrachochytrium dendrobatidis]|nr:dolichyl-diphosphooligosaccharide--protein glycosyltransferase subunit 1 [Batrachochytrium dendrobatidis]